MRNANYQPISDDDVREYIRQIAYYTQGQPVGRPTAVYNGLKAGLVVIACFFTVALFVFALGKYDRNKGKSDWFQLLFQDQPRVEGRKTK